MSSTPRWCILTFVLLGVQSVVMGQPSPQQTGDDSGTTRAVPAPAVSGIVGMDSDSGEQGDDTLPQIPSFLGGTGNTLALSSETERSNYLRGGVNISEGYNDNAFLTPTGQGGNTTFSVYPNISFAATTSRMRWTLGYAAGLSVNQKLSDQNQLSQNLTFDSLFRLSPHVNLHAAERFSMTSGIFGANGADFETATIGPSGTLITPLANQRSSQTIVEANYHFALKDVVGASGSFNSLNYSNVSTGAGTLADTQTASGTAFWLHQVFRGNWAGLSYNFARITYDPNGETKVNTFSFTDTLSISKAFHISGFVGPQYSQNQGVAATGPQTGEETSFSGWGVSGGVDAGWQSERMGVTAGYSKSVSSGSGVLGAVNVQNVRAAVRRELFPHWTVNVMGSYASNDALTLATVTTAPVIKTTTVGASLQRELGRSVGFQAAYFHDFQDQSGSTDITQNYNVNRNRFLVSVSYQWAKPLGR
jgi:hypothetical protein